MTTRTSAPVVHYDPYDVDIDDDPYPTWSRLRDEAPLYRNDELEFFALSRWDDVRVTTVPTARTSTSAAQPARLPAGRVSRSAATSPAAPTFVTTVRPPPDRSP